MMEENNDDCRTVGDALVYLAGPTHKKYSTTFVWGHPFSTYVSQDRFFNPSLTLVRIGSNCYCRRVVPKNSLKHNGTSKIRIKQYDAKATGE